MATKKTTGYKIDFTTNTLIMNYKFHAASQQYGSPEYKLVKSIKKNPNKLNITKHMTYENMALYIRQQDDAVEVMVEFKRQINLSKVKANPYRAVLAWFKKKYSDVNDYMDFFEELAAKNAEENDMFAVPANS